MIYKCTLIKDTPQFPAGTVFTAEDSEGFRGRRYECYKHDSLASLVDDPKWVKKEVFVEKAKDLRCPQCGETRGFMSVVAYLEGDRYEGYSNAAKVYFEYICGHGKIQLW